MAAGLRVGLVRDAKPSPPITHDEWVKLRRLCKKVGHPSLSRGLHANRERGRVGRLIRQNAISVVRTRKFKVPNSAHGAPTLTST
ncbi:hypothetical protein GALL_492310 [mine drainage metagenome]|uniref:Uncharacterized protein n=1 Tax=mine drainage metagenome TaxID=410659 RepID=A0A1J5PD67_9ZZZZ